MRRSIVDLAALCADVLLPGLAGVLFAQLEVLPLLGLPPEGGELVLVSLTLPAKIYRRYKRSQNFVKQIEYFTL